MHRPTGRVARPLVMLGLGLVAALATAPAGFAATFATGQLQAHTVGASGCGTNIAGEPAT